MINLFDLDKHPLRVLIVDDNQDMAEHIAFLCETFNFEPIVVNTVDEAIDMYDNCDVILLDMFLTQTHGAETVQIVATEMKVKPIIAMSAYYDKNIALKLIAQYVEDFIDKDVLSGNQKSLEGIILRTVHRFYRDKAKDLRKFVTYVKAIREV